MGKEDRELQFNNLLNECDLEDLKCFEKLIHTKRDEIINNYIQYQQHEIETQRRTYNERYIKMLYKGIEYINQGYDAVAEHKWNNLDTMMTAREYLTMAKDIELKMKHNELAEAFFVYLYPDKYKPKLGSPFKENKVTVKKFYEFITRLEDHIKNPWK